MENKIKTAACTMCKRLFEYSGFGHYYCPSCKVIDNANFDKVRDYIYQHGVPTMLQVADDTGVNMKYIRQYLREGRLEIPENSHVFIKCDICGCDIRSGRYCAECARTMNKDLKGTLVEIDPYMIGEKPKKVGKMRYLKND